MSLMPDLRLAWIHALGQFAVAKNRPKNNFLFLIPPRPTFFFEVEGRWRSCFSAGCKAIARPTRLAIVWVLATAFSVNALSDVIGAELDFTTCDIRIANALNNDRHCFEIPVTVFGETELFAVDTGSSRTTLNAKYQPRLREVRDGAGKQVTEKVSTHLGVVDKVLYESPVLKCGRITLSIDDPVWCEDVDDYRRIGGTIGIDILRQYQVLFDYDNRMICLWSNGKSSAPSGWTSSTLITTRTGLYGITGHLYHRQSAEILLIDTGTSDFMRLPDRAFRESVRTGDITEVGTAEYLSDGKLVNLPLGRIAALRVAGFEFSGGLVQSGRHSLVGGRFLARFKCLLDCPNNRMFLTPSERFEHGECVDLDGIDLFPMSPFDAFRKCRRIRSVQDGAPAYKLGLRAHDVLYTIGDAPFRSFETAEEQLFWSGPKDHCDLVVRRGDEMRTATVKLTSQQDLKVQYSKEGRPEVMP